MKSLFSAMLTLGSFKTPQESRLHHQPLADLDPDFYCLFLLTLVQSAKGYDRTGSTAEWLPRAKCRNKGKQKGRRGSYPNHAGLLPKVRQFLCLPLEPQEKASSSKEPESICLSKTRLLETIQLRETERSHMESFLK